MEREIPGSVYRETREYRYIIDDGNDNFFGIKKNDGLFYQILWKIKPHIPKNGGAITENCKLWIPTGELFNALSYRGDIEGWRMQIEKGAEQLGLSTAKVEDGNFIISDGRSFPLSDCKVEFY